MTLITFAVLTVLVFVNILSPTYSERRRQRWGTRQD